MVRRRTPASLSMSSCTHTDLLRIYIYIFIFSRQAWEEEEGGYFKMYWGEKNGGGRVGVCVSGMLDFCAACG